MTLRLIGAFASPHRHCLTGSHNNSSNSNGPCARSSRPLSQLTLETCSNTPKHTPAHRALRCHIDLSLSRLPDPSWKRCPGHPQNRWLDQLHGDNGKMVCVFVCTVRWKKGLEL